MVEEVPVAIIGAGPAGIAAAIQLKRMGHEPLVFEKQRVGGLLWNAHLVENYPGFPAGISGADLAGLMRDHMAAHFVKTVNEDVTSLETGDQGFYLTSRSGRLSVRRVILASGTRPRPMDSPEIPGEVVDRIFTEVFPIRDATGKRVAVVGAGDAAYDYALSLGSRNRVSIISRSAAPRCIPSLEARVASCAGIDVLKDTSVTAFVPRGGGVRLDCESRSGGAHSLHIDADYVILAVGRQPEVSFLDHRVVGALDDLAAAGRLRLVGDVARGSARQTAIAVGDGVAAAIDFDRRTAEDSHRSSEERGQ